MSTHHPDSGHWISVSGSNNNIAAGDHSHAGNTVSGDRGEAEVKELLRQIHDLAAGLADRDTAAQAQAASAAIESDLAKPPGHRFSIQGAMAMLSRLGETIPSLARLVDSLTKVLH